MNEEMLVRPRRVLVPNALAGTRLATQVGGEDANAISNFGLLAKLA